MIAFNVFYEVERESCRAKGRITAMYVKVWSAEWPVKILEAENVNHSTGITFSDHSQRREDMGVSGTS